MSEDFPLEPNRSNVRRLYSPPWTMDPFPFNQVMNGDGPCPFDPFTLGLETERTENPYQALLFQATENYHQGNFKTALTYLNQAIINDRDQPLGAFNVRAATYIKLGNLAGALDDGARMIRKHGSHPTGYLRAAQILKMQGKPAEALRIYERGLLRVAPTEPQFQVIQDSRDKLLSMSAHRRLRDPLEHLPKELALELMSHFTFRDIVRASQVCRSWRTFTFFHPSLWTHLDFTTGKRNPSFAAARAYLQRSRGQLLSISLPKDGPDVSQQGKILDYISHSALSYGQVEELIIGADSAREALVSFPIANLRKFEASSKVRFDFVRAYEILDRCPLLESAIFGSVTAVSGLHARPPRAKTFDTLQRLHISCPNGKEGSPDAALSGQMTRLFPNLQTLSLENFRYGQLGPIENGLSKLHQLETLRLLNSEIYGDLKLPASLKSISLERSECAANVTNPHSSQIPELTTISLCRYVHRSGPMSIRALLASSSGNLEMLNLSHMSADRSYMSAVFQEPVLRNVEALGLAELHVTDDNLAYLASVASRLKYINLSSTSVSGVGVKALVNGCKDTLTWIKLENCSKVSADAIEWARSLGIEVSYNFSDLLAGGRTIRPT